MGHSAAHPEATVTDEAMKEGKKEKIKNKKKKAHKVNRKEAVEFEDYIKRNSDAADTAHIDFDENHNLSTMLLSNATNFLVEEETNQKIKKSNRLDKIQKKLDKYSAGVNCKEYPFIVRDHFGYTNFYFFFLQDLNG